MKIGLVGYLRFGNFGDELFGILYKKLLNHHEIIIINESSIYPWIFDFNKLHKLDLIIIIGGDMINPKYYSTLYFNKYYLQLNIPIYVFNVGVAVYYQIDDSYKKDYQNFFKNDNVKYVSLRDQVSYKWCIDNHIIPEKKLHLFDHDIVFGMDLQRSVRSVNDYIKSNRKQKTLGIVLRKAFDFKIDYTKFANDLVKLSNVYNIHLIVAGTNSTQLDDIQEYINIITLLKDKNIDYSFLVPDSTHDIVSYIDDCDIIISKKYHVCIVGMMFGKIVYTLNSENKFKTLFDNVDMSDNIISINDHQLVDKILQSKNNTEYYDKISSIMKKTLHFHSDIINMIDCDKDKK